MSVFPAVRPAVTPAVRGAFEQGSGGGAASIIAGLFAQGQQGFWLPFTDFASLSQDSAGTLPYTALEQPIGLILDKSRGLELGAELIGSLASLTPFITNAAGTVGVWNAATQTMMNTVVGANNSHPRFQFSFPSTAGRFYRLEGKLSGNLSAALSSDASIRLRFTTGGTDYHLTINIATGVFSAIQRTTGTLEILLDGNTKDVPVKLESLSIRELKGNHAVQPTPTARGKISAKYNILERTQDIANAYWAKYGLVITSGAVVAPDGTMTGDKIAADATNVQHRFIKNLQAQSGDTIKVRGRFQKAEVSVVVFEYLATQFFCEINLNTGTITSSGGGGVNITSTSYSIENLGGGWFEVVMNGTLTSYVNALLTVYPETKTAKVGDGISGFYVGGFDFRVAGRDLPYQRVDAVAVYATAGFPIYASIDGADDFYTTAGGGGSTTGFFFSDVMRPMGGAGTRRVIWSDRSGNNGYELAINASDKLEFSAGNGTAITTVSSTVSATVAEGKRYEVMDDGTNLSVQIDGSAAVTIARPVVTAGSSTITLYRGASTGYFNGQATEPIYRAGPPPSAYERSVIRTYQMQKAGML